MLFLLFHNNFLKASTGGQQKCKNQIQSTFSCTRKYYDQNRGSSLFRAFCRQNMVLDYGNWLNNSLLFQLHK